MIAPLPSLNSARLRVTEALLSTRNAEGHWPGELSSSALSTATAVCALAVVDRKRADGAPEVRSFIEAGLRWLAANVNADGGWGDTNRSISNLSTTTLVWAAFGIAGCHGNADDYSGVLTAAERWLLARTGSLEPGRLARRIADCYGDDRTFSIPILTMCAIAGRLGPDATAWSHVIQLPFELAALPARWFGAVRLPVVSYALPALIAVGQVRHFFRPTKNPVARLLRSAVRTRTLRVLESVQPKNGGFLEATPLTSFVTMSLGAMGLTEHRVVRRGVDFLIRSARPDGSWVIDTNLATWLTTLSVNALPAEALNAEARARIRDWLLGQQYRTVHLYTNAAPGGWAWTNLPGGVPDADDTAGALLALRRLGPVDDAVRQAARAGVRWLVDLQNSDGGIPTFCKGWGTLPFDRSSPDITAHALRAWLAWREDLAEPKEIATSQCPSSQELDRAIRRAWAFLRARQRDDGSWVPLWFGHQHAVNDENPVYGTARVLLALVELDRSPAPLSGLPEAMAAGWSWLVDHQNIDGGWSGAPGAASSVEETAVAVEALAAVAACATSHDAVSGRALILSAMEAGVGCLVRRLCSGEPLEPAPIGFYFARLWYYEQLYPLIFVVAALKGRCEGPDFGGY